MTGPCKRARPIKRPGAFSYLERREIQGGGAFSARRRAGVPLRAAGLGYSVTVMSATVMFMVVKSRATYWGAKTGARSISPVPASR